MTNSVGTSSNRINWVLHHFNPPSVNGNFTKQKQAWEEQHCVLQRDKGMQTQAQTSEATMSYSFLALQFLLLQCIQDAQYIALQIGNGGSSSSILKEYGSPRVKLFGDLWGKLNFFCLHAHFLMYAGFGSKAVCTHKYFFKSHVYT